MPALSCRDIDEVCDWFWRDDDVGRLMISDMIHSEEQHGTIMKAVIDDAISGKKKISVLFEDYVKFMRWK